MMRFTGPFPTRQRCLDVLLFLLLVGLISSATLYVRWDLTRVIHRGMAAAADRHATRNQDMIREHRRTQEMLRRVEEDVRCLRELEEGRELWRREHGGGEGR
jgi:hypothetical protein